MKKEIKIFLVEDNPDHATLIKRALREDDSHRYHFTEFNNGETVLEALQNGAFQPDLVLLDYKIPGKDGMEVLLELKHRGHDTPVLMMTSHASIETAVLAIREGAVDYLTKPFRNSKTVILSVTRALRHQEILAENRFLRSQIGQTILTSPIIGNSPEMDRIFKEVKRIAPTNSTVLITGESGTGKEILARYIHSQSRRSSEKFVAINCSTLPENLLESELFGHIRGAFTGAVSNKIGLLKEADRGTFFFDEIAELTMTMQTKLLRFLQDQEIRQTGSVRSEMVDVRIIAATNLKLAQQVHSGKFREDLFYRLNVIHIHLPSLHDRKEDIPAFVEYFIDHYTRTEGRSIRGIEPEALQFLMKFSWPGNIRQLKNVIERALILTDDGRNLSLNSLAFLDTAALPAPPSKVSLTFHDARQHSLNEFAAGYLRAIMRKFKGNVTRAAQASGLGRQSFHRLLKAHRLRSEDFRK